MDEEMKSLTPALLLFSAASLAQHEHTFQVEHIFQHALKPSAKNIDAYALEGRYVLNDRFFVYGRYEDEKFDTNTSAFAHPLGTLWQYSDVSTKYTFLGAGYRDELRYGVNFSAIIFGAHEQSESQGTTFIQSHTDLRDVIEDDFYNKRDASGYGYRLALTKSFTDKLDFELRIRNLRFYYDEYDLSDEQIGASLSYRINRDLSATLGVEDRDNQAFLGLAYHF